MQERNNTIEDIFENIHIIRQKIANEMNLPIEKMPLTYSQLQVLNHVRKNKSINIKDLAGLLDITSSAATQIVDGLVNKGLLSRKRSRTDRRVLEIGLSSKSLLLLKKTMDKICHIFDVLDNNELHRYCELTCKLAGKHNNTTEDV